MFKTLLTAAAIAAVSTISAQASQTDFNFDSGIELERLDDCGLGTCDAAFVELVPGDLSIAAVKIEEFDAFLFFGDSSTYANFATNSGSYWLRNFQVGDVIDSTSFSEESLGGAGTMTLLFGEGEFAAGWDFEYGYDTSGYLGFEFAGRFGWVEFVMTKVEGDLFPWFGKGSIATTASESITVGSFENSLEAPAPVPLPAALPLFATGLLGMGVIRLRRKPS